LNADLTKADRADAVRSAARGWCKAGILDAAGLAAIELRHPDDRQRASVAMRILLFGFTLFAFSSFFVFIALAASAALPGVLIFAGVAMAVLTEVLLGAGRRRQGGVEAATSLIAVTCFLSGITWLLTKPYGSDFESHLLPQLCIAAAILAVAAWRWGYPVYAGAATVAFLLALLQLPVGRLLWILVPLAATLPLLQASRSPRLPPAHRHSLTTTLLVGLSGLYAAVNVFGWDNQVLETLGGQPRANLGPILRRGTEMGEFCWVAAAVATAVVPIALLLVGFRLRLLGLLILGAATAVLSLVTLHSYVPNVRMWLALTLLGGAAMAVALALTRWLNAGANGERHGFTAAAVFEDARRRQAFELGAVVLTALNPLTAEPPRATTDPGFVGGGGHSGGGGASGEF
jgi:hypothetical protein